MVLKSPIGYVAGRENKDQLENVTRKYKFKVTSKREKEILM